MLWITFHIIIRARAPEENQHKQSVMTSPATESNLSPSYRKGYG